MSRRRSSDKENRTPGQRQLRVGEEIRHLLADLLERGNMRDPDLREASITVTSVDVSPDLRNATAFVMPLGGEDGERIIKALARNAKPLRAELSKRIRQLKYMPDLRFRLDTRFDDDDRMRDALADPVVAADLSRDDGEGEGR
jgi:ribosome-binding factor A